MHNNASDWRLWIMVLRNNEAQKRGGEWEAAPPKKSQTKTLSLLYLLVETEVVIMDTVIDYFFQRYYYQYMSDGSLPKLGIRTIVGVEFTD
jgi:hypothetical protein